MITATNALIAHNCGRCSGTDHSKPDSLCSIHGQERYRHQSYRYSHCSKCGEPLSADGAPMSVTICYGCYVKGGTE